MGGYITMETLILLTFLSVKNIQHKGDYGKILLIGGIPANLGGAIMLAARACVFSGSGLITVAHTSNKSFSITFSLPRSDGY